MRTLVIALALSSTLLATPALARDGAFYVGGELGGMMVSETEIDIGATSNAVAVDHDLGFDGSVFAGYDFGSFRVEAEASYKVASLDSYTTRIRLPLDPPTFPTQGDAGGSSSALSFMANGMLDLGDDDGTSFFVGGGIGVAQVSAEEYRNQPTATPFIDTSESGKWNLAWQAFAGVRQAIGDNIDLSLKYRFFNSETDLIAFNGAQSSFRFQSHSLLAGLTFSFGN